MLSADIPRISYDSHLQISEGFVTGPVAEGEHSGRDHVGHMTGKFESITFSSTKHAIGAKQRWHDMKDATLAVSAHAPRSRWPSWLRGRGSRTRPASRSFLLSRAEPDRCRIRPQESL